MESADAATTSGFPSRAWGSGAPRIGFPLPGCDEDRSSLHRILRRGQGDIERRRASDAGYGSGQDVGCPEGARFPPPAVGMVSRLSIEEVDIEPVLELVRPGLAEERGDPFPGCQPAA